MRKALILATAALFITGASFADGGKGKAKKACCSKDKACCHKASHCCKKGDHSTAKL